jgi:adenylate cyclase
MVAQVLNLSRPGALSRANTASNALVTPETSLFLREILERALANPVGVAPRWAAEAWALLANVLVNDYLRSWNHAGRVELNKAEAAMENALALNSELALAHHAKGLILRARGDHDGAFEAFEKAVELDPNFARAHAQKGNEFILRGQPADALPCVQRAIELSPNDAALGTFYWIKGRAHFFAGNYDAAIQPLEQSVELRTNFWYNWAYLVAATAFKDKDRAGAILAQFKSLFGELTLKDIKEYEKANPDDNKVVVDARDALHRLLQDAGMREQ